MKKLDIHITDIVEKIDLKIFEEDIEDITVFTLDVYDSRTETQAVIKIEEKVAALLFEGLSHIFIEDDKVQAEDNHIADVFEKFFKTLNKKDKEHFEG